MCLSAFVSALGSHEMGHRKSPTIINSIIRSVVKAHGYTYQEVMFSHAFSETFLYVTLTRIVQYCIRLKIVDKL